MLPADWKSRIDQFLWTDHHGQAPWQRALLILGRHLFSLARELIDGQLSMRAMSLVYTTLLSLVPLLALSFSVLKALNIPDKLEPTLQQFLAPLGPQGDEITKNLIGFVEKTNVGALGFLGVLLLFYTAISMIQKVESSFNAVWRIERVRPIGQRVSEYLTVLMIGPVVVFAALGMTHAALNSSELASLQGFAPVETLISWVGRLIPYLMIVAMFTFLYIFIPNTKVRIGAAAIGGASAGILWQTSSLAFASFVAGASNYNAIYSSFAIIIFLLIWLYVSWLILLIGCQIVYFSQHPANMLPRTESPVPGARRSEYLALVVLGMAGQRFIEGRRGYSEEEFVAELGAIPEHINQVVEALIKGGYLTESGRSRTTLIPARDLESISVADVWRDVRADADGALSEQTALGRDALGFITDAEDGFANLRGQLSVREWLKTSAKPEGAP